VTVADPQNDQNHRVAAKPGAQCGKPWPATPVDFFVVLRRPHENCTRFRKTDRRIRLRRMREKLCGIGEAVVVVVGLSERRTMSPSDREIRERFAKINADFGDEDPVEVVRQGVLKVASGFHNGSACWEILRHFGLAWFDDRDQAVLSSRGQQYLWDWVTRLNNKHEPASCECGCADVVCAECGEPIRAKRKTMHEMQKKKITAVIQIGNSDNKLTQNNWAHFVASMRSEISRSVYRIHFQGGSDWDAPWQNACWVCEVRPEQIEPLREAVAKVRGQYEQDSAAVVFGETEFI
jgi:hypothetical protein